MEASDAAKNGQDRPPKHNYPAQNVSSIVVGKLCQNITIKTPKDFQLGGLLCIIPMAHQRHMPKHHLIPRAQISL